MKKSVIKDIFYGKKGYREVIQPPQKDMENLELICELEDKIKSKFSPEQLDLHNKFVDAIEKNCCDEVDFYFVEGFKLGLLVGIEAMEDEQ